MLIKDQLQVRMDQLNVTIKQLAKHVGVSDQSVRHWIAGRSFPGKAKCNLIEEALSFKLDFSEGNTGQTETIERKLLQTDLAARNAVSLLPPDIQVMMAKLAARILELYQSPPPRLAHSMPARPGINRQPVQLEVTDRLPR